MTPEPPAHDLGERRMVSLRPDHDKSLIDVRCPKCRHVQRNEDGPCAICGNGVGEYLADFLYPRIISRAALRPFYGGADE